MANSPVGLPSMPNKNLYNGGSEWQNDYNNLPDYYQATYRNYDAVLGRFTGVDPMAEGVERMSTYQYENNNPLMFNDPLGTDATTDILPLFASPADDIMRDNMGHGRGHHMKHTWHDFDWDNNDLLKRAQSGDMAALQAYAQIYGVSAVWKKWGKEMTDDPAAWIAMGGSKEVYDKTVAEGSVELWVGAWVFTANQGDNNQAPVVKVLRIQHGLCEVIMLIGQQCGMSSGQEQALHIADLVPSIR